MKKSASKIRSDKLYLENINIQLETIEAYTNVLKMLLQIKFNAFETANAYYGESEYEQFINMATIDSLKSYEIKTMSELLISELDNINKNNLKKD